MTVQFEKVFVADKRFKSAGFITEGWRGGSLPRREDPGRTGAQRPRYVITRTGNTAGKSAARPIDTANSQYRNLGPKDTRHA